MAPRSKRKKKDSTLEQVDSQMDDLCTRLGAGLCPDCDKQDPKPSSCVHNELSPNQRASMIRELRQFLRLRSQLESAAPVDEAKLAQSEIYQAQCKAVAAAVKDCDRCCTGVLKALKVNV